MQVLVAGFARTPIGKFLGSLSTLSAVELGAVAVRGALNGAGIRPDEVGELIFGNARQAGGGPNPARQIAHASGIPAQVPSFTVNKACGSGMKAITLAAGAILSGESDVVVAGGAESMSRVPFLLPDLRRGHRLGSTEIADAMYRDGFLCPLCDQLMGETAETLADRYSISRAEQDRFAAASQAKAVAAIAEGRLASQIVAVEVRARKETVTVATDEHPRPGVTVESLARLPPVFRADGTVHAGNSSGITDGSAALVLVSERFADRKGIEGLGRVGAWSSAGVGPEVMGLGPVRALAALEKKTGRPASSYDLVEINEAFAVQVLACLREIEIPAERLNVNGGAIALGHPIGCTGARICVTLLAEMARTGASSGVATLCISGGQGMAVEFTIAQPDIRGSQTENRRTQDRP